jgi:hypothetical protein
MIWIKLSLSSAGSASHFIILFLHGNHPTKNKKLNEIIDNIMQIAVFFS